ncbi:cytochrome P450 [Streptomyces sp. NPDC090499]|uniref:cytochrome P450 family protein n=1 Tax=unclassified Streptomyces TaxID=2593676 RepID=UPI00382DDACB
MSAKEAPEIRDIDVSAANLEASACPWATHAKLRERGPVVKYPTPTGHSQYAVTRYEDVVAALQDPRFAKDSRHMAELFPAGGATAQQSGFVLSGASSRHLLNTDPPDHTRLRRLVSRAFTPRRVASLRPRIQEIVDGLLDDLARSEAPDLIGDFAFALSITVICELLGVPAEHRADFRTWSVAATTPAGDDPSAIQEAGRRLNEFLTDHIATKRADLAGHTDPRTAPDVLSAMIISRDADDGLSDSELVGMAFLLLIAGHETTVGLIGSMALGLWRHQDQRRLLLDDPGLIDSAVEEFLRFEGAVQRSTFRVATEDVEIADTRIPKGSMVTMLIGSANHDPDHFDNPDELNITRDPDRHVAFGQGIHFCLGAPLARAEAAIAISTLLKRFPTYSVTAPDDELTYQPTVIRALAALPVELEPKDFE